MIVQYPAVCCCLCECVDVEENMMLVVSILSTSALSTAACRASVAAAFSPGFVTWIVDNT